MMQLILSALAGAIGGASIAGLGMIYSAAVGGGLWSLPNSIGALLPGAKKHAKYNPLWLAISLHALYGAITGAVAAALI